MQKVIFRCFFIVVSTFIVSQITYAQTQFLEGKVSDNSDSSPLVAAVVSVNGSEAYTDLEGNYKLSLEPNTNYIVTISYPDYQTKEISEVNITANQNTLLNVSLSKIVKSSENLNEVVVKTSKKTESIASLITLQKNVAFVAQVVSTEAIKRSPDKNTGEILKRVSGTSVQDGKYLVVRGLGDRYNQAMLNGVQLASTEPDRKTFSFDLFPASVIDNLIINKTFIPEMTGEWAGGLIQVQTKDIPTKNFFTLQIGNGYNMNAISEKFYSYKGGKYDFLGIDDGYRGLPSGFPAKNKFAALSSEEKTNFGKEYVKNFSLTSINFPQNLSLQANGGFNTKLFGKEFGGIIGLTYSNSFKRTEFDNKNFNINGQLKELLDENHTERYNNDILVGLLANFSIKLNNNNKITLKNLLSSNTSDAVSIRTGKDYFASQEGDGITDIKAREFVFNETTFLNSVLSGNHKIDKLGIVLNWYGSFGILDQYIPMQQRLQYVKDPNSTEYLALLSGSLSQKSGSFFYSTLNDYLYNAGGDVSKTFELFKQKQTIKAGYAFQVKDRIYNSRPFGVILTSQTSNDIKLLSEETIFNSENFGIGADKFQFDEIPGSRYRYIANTILNAGFIQFDNNFTDWLRILWGVRVENYDQLVGSEKKSDERFINTEVRDWLPALNVTIKTSDKTNIRVAASQTVVRPEFRELSNFAFFDFELGATIQGNTSLKRTKITNFDLRYEFYPRSGELITAALFYKKFDDPIELYFNQAAGGGSTFNYLNPDQATAYGIEIEGRKKLDFISFLKNFTLGGNVSFINNKVEDTTINIDRPMQGQSPYTLNLSLQYDVEKIGLTSTLLFNRIGRRIYYVGSDQFPNLWEAPRSLLDFQVTKKILSKKGELKLNISDILNEDANFYYDLDDDKKYTSNIDGLGIKRKYGTTISFSFAYNF